MSRITRRRLLTITGGLLGASVLGVASGHRRPDESVSISDVHPTPGTADALQQELVETFEPPGALVVTGRDVPEALYAAAHFRVGDYLADDEAIRDAIDAGAQIKLVGRFDLRSPIVNTRSELSFVGQGPNTVLRATDDFPLNRALVETGQTGAYCPNVMIANLMFDGRGVGTNVDGLRFNSYRGRVMNCWFQNFSRDGLRISGHWINKPTDAMFAFINSGWNGGIGVNGISDVDCHYSQVVVHSNQGGGLNLNSASQQVTSVHSYSNGNFGVRIRGARTKLSLCKIEHNEQGVLIISEPGHGAWQFQINASSFRGGAGSEISDLIHVQDGTGATNGIISGCHFMATDDSGAAKARHAIKLSANARRYVIVGNLFEGQFGGDPLLVAGEGHAIQANLGT